MPTPPVSSQRTQPQPTTTPPPPAGATRVGASNQAQTGPRTSGTDDSFAANGQRPPQYQAGQQVGQTSGGTPVTAGREAGDFYCEHAFFISNEFANQPGSSVSRDGNGQPLATFIHHPGLLDQPNSPDRQAGAREVVGATLRGYVDSARGQVPGNEPIKVLLSGYGEFAGVKNNPTQDFVTHPENLDAAMSQGFPGNLVRNADGTPQRQRLDDVNGQPVFRYAIRNEDGTNRNVDVMSALLPVNDNAINGGAQSLQRLEQDFQPNAIINMGVNPGGRTWQMETRADDGGMRRTGNMQFTDGSSSRQGAWEYENASGANAVKAGQEAIQRDRTAATSMPVSQLPVPRQISPS